MGLLELQISSFGLRSVEWGSDSKHIIEVLLSKCAVLNGPLSVDIVRVVEVADTGGGMQTDGMETTWSRY